MIRTCKILPQFENCSMKFGRVVWELKTPNILSDFLKQQTAQDLGCMRIGSSKSTGELPNLVIISDFPIPYA